MTTPQQKMDQLGISLPALAKSVGAYVPAVRVGNMVCTSGQLPLSDGKLVSEGKVPTETSVEEAHSAARQAVLSALAAVCSQAGSLDNIAKIVRVNVFVNSAPGFTDQARVANGASELLLEVFGDSGKHTRCALGVAELPLNAPVELDLTVELKPGV